MGIYMLDIYYWWLTIGDDLVTMLRAIFMSLRFAKLILGLYQHLYTTFLFVSHIIARVHQGLVFQIFRDPTLHELQKAHRLNQLRVMLG